MFSIDDSYNPFVDVWYLVHHGDKQKQQVVTFGIAEVIVSFEDRNIRTQMHWYFPRHTQIRTHSKQKSH